MTRWLIAVRALYGVALLVAPATMACERVDRASRRVLRVLGARELLQAELTRQAPTARRLFAGAAVDGVHAASMVAVANFDERRRQLALRNAATASLLAVGSVIAASQGGCLAQ